jgi:hypothetical protein
MKSLIFYISLYKLCLDYIYYKTDIKNYIVPYKLLIRLLGLENHSHYLGLYMP